MPRRTSIPPLTSEGIYAFVLPHFIYTSEPRLQSISAMRFSMRNHSSPLLSLLYTWQRKISPFIIFYYYFYYHAMICPNKRQLRVIDFTLVLLEVRKELCSLLPLRNPWWGRSHRNICPWLLQTVRREVMSQVLTLKSSTHISLNAN